jgi:transposase InsO family protein
LALPNDADVYVLDTDASGDAIGAVLSQIQEEQERVICYGSRACSAAERNYDVTKRELLAIVHFLKMFRPYLLGRKFLLRTDHSALQWLRRTPLPIGQQARWLAVIEEYHFEIRHRAGTAHRNADAMSRRPYQVDMVQENQYVQTGTSALPNDWDRQTIKDEQRADPDLGWIIARKLESAEMPTHEDTRSLSGTIKILVAQWPQLVIHNGLLVRKWLNAETDEVRGFQLIPPVTHRSQLIRLAHEGITGGHMGIRRTTAQLQKRAYWPRWRQQVKMQLRRCEPCAAYFRGKLPRQGQLQMMSVGEPMECLSVDITGPHPVSSKGNKYILTAVDHFTRWAEAHPIRNQEATTVARVLVEEVFCRFGCPRQILTDQGSCFEAALFQDICKRLQIDKIRTTPYKPSTNGAVERFHRTLNAMLGKVVAQNQRDWDVHVPFLLAAYRASESESTGFTPNHLFLSRELCLPIDLVLGDMHVSNVVSTTDDFVADQMHRICKNFAVAREFMKRQATSRAFRYDMRVKPAAFNKGDWVWMFYPRRRPGIKDKWAKLYTGPYRVVAQLSPVLYKVQKSARAQPKLVYVDKLKYYFGDPPNNWDLAEVDRGFEPSALEIPDCPEDTGEIENPREDTGRPKRLVQKPLRYR